MRLAFHDWEKSVNPIVVGRRYFFLGVFNLVVGFRRAPCGYEDQQLGVVLNLVVSERLRLIKTHFKVSEVYIHTDSDAAADCSLKTWKH